MVWMTNINKRGHGCRSCRSSRSSYSYVRIPTPAAPSVRPINAARYDVISARSNAIVTHLLRIQPQPVHIDLYVLWYNTTVSKSYHHGVMEWYARGNSCHWRLTLHYYRQCIISAPWTIHYTATYYTSLSNTFISIYIWCVTKSPGSTSNDTLYTV